MLNDQYNHLLKLKEEGKVIEIPNDGDDSVSVFASPGERHYVLELIAIYNDGAIYLSQPPERANSIIPGSPISLRPGRFGAVFSKALSVQLPLVDFSNILNKDQKDVHLAVNVSLNLHIMLEVKPLNDIVTYNIESKTEE